MATIIKRPLVPCPFCKGQKLVPLADRLFKVYAVIYELKTSTPPEVHKKLRTRKVVAATNNSLAALFSLGLLTRVKIKRTWNYTICGPQKT